ncbi:MAG: SDR family NAD(P)-dependent oxidoreductase [Candidatus Dadabacteria bacterium]|nr:SDR family NAD(P)-dependent oxidoreductase [Candidatus Dadabacteria bacterium]
MGRDLKDKVAIITGASSGIGLETALEFAKKGVKTVLAARREDRLNEAAERVKTLGSEALVVKTDVSRWSQVQRMVKQSIERFGRVDIMVNNAGYGLLATIEDTTYQEMKDIFDVNFMGTFYATNAVLPHMKKQGSGHIINISSVAGARGMPLLGAYSVTKFGQKALTEALRVELAGTGIDVSVVCPVFIESEFFKSVINKTNRQMDAPKWLTQSSNKVARSIVKCAENPKPEVLPYPMARIFIALNAIWPGFIDFLLRKNYKSFTKDKETTQPGDEK